MSRYLKTARFLKTELEELFAQADPTIGDVGLMVEFDIKAADANSIERWALRYRGHLAYLKADGSLHESKTGPLIFSRDENIDPAEPPEFAGITPFVQVLFKKADITRLLHHGDENADGQGILMMQTATFMRSPKGDGFYRGLMAYASTPNKNPMSDADNPKTTEADRLAYVEALRCPPPWDTLANKDLRVVSFDDSDPTPLA